jgi:hypothetical protein
MWVSLFCLVSSHGYPAQHVLRRLSKYASAYGTYKAVLQPDNVSMIDRLENADLAFQVLQQLGCQFLSGYRFDGA